MDIMYKGFPESGAAAPELTKLVALSELFSVSVDYLVKDRLENPERPSEAPLMYKGFPAFFELSEKNFSGFWIGPLFIFAVNVTLKATPLGGICGYLMF